MTSEILEGYTKQNNMANKFDVHDPEGVKASDNTGTVGPCSLQASCKTSILKAAGLDKAKDLRQKLELPKTLLSFLTQQFSTDDFFINGDEVTAEDIDSSTYHATCLIDNRQVLLKCIPFSSVTEDKFVEIQKWSNLEVPGIQKCYTNFREKDKLFYVMQYSLTNVESLSKCFHSTAMKLQEETIWYVLHQIANTLSAIKEQNMTYNDLTAKKVLIDCDAGILLENGMLSVTNEGSVMEQFVMDDSGIQGVYTAPEAIAGDDISWASVVWGIGCIVYELANRRPAYVVEDASNLFEALNAIVEGQVPDAIDDQYSDKLKNIISSCLNTDASERPEIAALLETASSMVPSNTENALNELKCCN